MTERSSTSSVASTASRAGSSLNLDLCMGASDVIDRLRFVNPTAITHVSLEYNLMAELVFDQEWMAILEAIGSLPLIHTVSLSFRVPVPLPLQALNKLIELATTLDTLNLSGLQLSTRRSTSTRWTEDSEDPLEDLMRACQRHTSLRHVGLCRYRPVKTTRTKDGRSTTDPLLRALLQIPRLNVLHIERTDIFSDPTVLDMVCRAPIPILKIGTLERSMRLERYLPSMAQSLEENPKLKEMIVHHMLQGDAVVAMAQLLQTNTSLQKVALRIQSNDFGKDLAVALEGNTTLQIFELNVMADRTSFRKSIGILAAALGGNQNSALTTLKLDATGIRTSAIMTEPFLKMLREDNFVLKNLLINRNTIPFSNDILFYLKLNSIGRNHYLRRGHVEFEREGVSELGLVASRTGRSKDFRQEWVNMLIQNKADVRVLHYFISRNPLILPLLV